MQNVSDLTLSLKMIKFIFNSENVTIICLMFAFLFLFLHDLSSSYLRLIYPELRRLEQSVQ